MISQNVDPVKPTSRIMDPNVIGAEHIPLPTNSETHENRQKSSSAKVKDAVLIYDDVKLLEESWTTLTQLYAIESQEILEKNRKDLVPLLRDLETKIKKIASQVEKKLEQLGKELEQSEKKNEQLEKEQEQLEKKIEDLLILLIDKFKNRLKRLRQQMNDYDDANVPFKIQTNCQVPGPFDDSRHSIAFFKICFFIITLHFIFAYITH